MADAPQQTPAAQEEVPADQPAPAKEESPADPPAKTEQELPEKKSVKFENEDLSFDEAQAEIDAIRARARGARENLKTDGPTSSSSSYVSTSSYKGSSYDDDTPKSKNMLSHLNSLDAMRNYKIQAARSLVRKQEDLLRNLARMRENMERSECEVYKASDYYTPSRYSSKRYNSRAESAPVTRPQVRDPSPVNTTSYDDEKKYEKPLSPPTHSSYTSYSISAKPNPISTTDYQPDEDFEREMAAIRKRVANIAKQANEVYTPKLRSYDYLYDDYTTPSITSRYLQDYDDLYKVPQPSYEVTRARQQPYTTSTTTYYYVPEPVEYVHVPSYHTTEALPETSNSYTKYLLESIDDQPSHYKSSPDLTNFYYEPELSNVYYAY